MKLEPRRGSRLACDATRKVGQWASGSASAFSACFFPEWSVKLIVFPYNKFYSSMVWLNVSKYLPILCCDRFYLAIAFWLNRWQTKRKPQKHKTLHSQEMSVYLTTNKATPTSIKLNTSRHHHARAPICFSDRLCVLTLFRENNRRPRAVW